MEKQEGIFDFTLYDIRIFEVLKRGLFLQIKMNTMGSSDPEGKFPNVPPWVWARRNSLLLRADVKQPIRNPFTMNGPWLNRQIARFYYQTARHFRSLPVINYSPFHSCYGELEFFPNHYSDYSEPAEKAFREWLKKKYGSPSTLAKAWGRQITSFDQVNQPHPSEGVSNETSPEYYDWILFREDTLDEFTRITADALHAGDPKARYSLQVGRIYSAECAKRGTFAFIRYLSRCDSVWVDPAPRDDVCFQTSIAATARLIGKDVCVELDGPYAYRRDGVNMPKAYPKQTEQAFSAGARLVTTANWSFGAGKQPDPNDDMHKVRPALEGMARVYLSKFLNLRLSPASPDGVTALFVSHAELYRLQETNAPFENLYSAWEASSPGNRRPVIISDWSARFSRTSFAVFRKSKIVPRPVPPGRTSSQHWSRSETRSKAPTDGALFRPRCCADYPMDSDLPTSPN